MKPNMDIFVSRVVSTVHRVVLNGFRPIVHTPFRLPHPTPTWKRRSLLLAGFLLFLGVHGCLPSPPNTAPDAGAKPTVVSTSTILTDLTQAIGGDQIQLIGILNPGDDPHVYEPVPQASRSLEDADLILYNGYNLEPGLIRLINSTGGKARKLAAGEVVPPLQLEYKSQRVPDPHVWGDVKNVSRMVIAIRDALIDIAPAERDRFTQNTTKLLQDLEQLDRWITQQINTIPANNRKLVTTHDAFQYYGQAYGLDLAGTLIGISTEEQPSPQTVKHLVDTVRAAKVPSIFAETTINPSLIKTVAEEAGVNLAPRQLYSDSIGAPGSDGDTYIKMMVANTRTIAEALGGQVTPFAP